MNVTELECDIKKELRSSMNGILSARMREAGMPYKLIFGVELPRLQSIADEFPQNTELANHLWSQNIRETRLLAIMLMPPEAFSIQMANEWAETMATAEEAQVMAKILLSKAKEAKEISIAWMAGSNYFSATCACLCLRHLLMRGTCIDNKLQVIANCNRMFPEANLHLRKAIQALKEALNEQI
ncbi:MAG: DNA alkylation repair protein [Bacteroidaceae bacterium]|nr:DNA alkylation repair protein [Bacteroidaceae bacterium]